MPHISKPRPTEIAEFQIPRIRVGWVSADVGVAASFTSRMFDPIVAELDRVVFSWVTCFSKSLYIS